MKTKISPYQKEALGTIAMFAGLTLVSFAPEFPGKYVLGIIISSVGAFYALGCSKQ
jgi:hypothetical protein